MIRAIADYFPLQLRSDTADIMSGGIDIVNNGTRETKGTLEDKADWVKRTLPLAQPMQPDMI